MPHKLLEALVLLAQTARYRDPREILGVKPNPQSPWWVGK